MDEVSDKDNNMVKTDINYKTFLCIHWKSKQVKQMRLMRSTAASSCVNKQ